MNYMYSLFYFSFSFFRAHRTKRSDQKKLYVHFFWASQNGAITRMNILQHRRNKKSTMLTKLNPWCVYSFNNRSPRVKTVHGSACAEGNYGSGSSKLESRSAIYRMADLEECVVHGFFPPFAKGAMAFSLTHSCCCSSFIEAMLAISGESGFCSRIPNSQKSSKI